MLEFTEVGHIATVGIQQMGILHEQSAFLVQARTFLIYHFNEHFIYNVRFQIVFPIAYLTPNQF